MRECNCIFCKIANGEIPSVTLYEDEDFRVILDLGPATRGHALLLPKEHYRDLFELEDEVAAKVLVRAKRIAGRMKKHLGQMVLIWSRTMGKRQVRPCFIFICT